MREAGKILAACRRKFGKSVRLLRRMTNAHQPQLDIVMTSCPQIRSARKRTSANDDFPMFERKP